MSSTSYHHGNLRQVLLNAAIGLIQESGPEGFTLREVARRAQVSHTAPYRHFRDKNDLLAAVAEQGFLNLSEAMAGAARHARNPLVRLHRLGLAYVISAVQRPAHFRVMFGVRLHPEDHAAAWTAGTRAFQVLVDAISACQEANLVRQGDPVQLAHVAWSLVHGIAQLVIARRLPFKSEKELAGFVNLASQALSAGLKNENT